MPTWGSPSCSTPSFPRTCCRPSPRPGRKRADSLGLDPGGYRPLSTNCVVADSDEEAREGARQYLAAFFALQADHYEADADHWKDIEGYRQFSRSFGMLRTLSDPANLDRFLDNQLIGSPRTVSGRLEHYRDMGFDHVIMNFAREGWPVEMRETSMRRFATEVAPAFRTGPGLAAR